MPNGLALSLNRYYPMPSNIHHPVPYPSMHRMQIRSASRIPESVSWKKISHEFSKTDLPVITEDSLHRQVVLAYPYVRRSAIISTMKYMPPLQSVKERSSPFPYASMIILQHCKKDTEICKPIPWRRRSLLLFNGIVPTGGYDL